MVLVCRLELGHSLCLYLQKGILEKKKKKGGNQKQLEVTKAGWEESGFTEKNISVCSMKKPRISLRDQIGEKGYKAIIWNSTL